MHLNRKAEMFEVDFVLVTVLWKLVDLPFVGTVETLLSKFAVDNPNVASFAIIDVCMYWALL